jgi:hypothetical protein
MVVVSYSGREINAKIVYYGPGLCGKTTNLERIYEAVPAANKGKMISMKTKADRTLFFDFLPLELGDVGGFRTRLMLYTVPGQVFYNATRKLVLKGVDALVFVVDSERGKMQENRESLENLRENLESYGLDLDEIPLVFQYNKRDLPSIYTREELDQGLMRGDRPMVEASAAKGEGVFETLRLVSELLLTRLRARLGSTAGAAAKREAEPLLARPAPAGQDGVRPSAAPGALPALPALPAWPAAQPLAQPLAPPLPAAADRPTLAGPEGPAPVWSEVPPSAPRARIPLAAPIPVVRRPGPGAEGNAPPGLPPEHPMAPEPRAGLSPAAPAAPAAGSAPETQQAPARPQFEIVRLDSVAREQMRAEESRDRAGTAPLVRSSRRIVVPIELDLDQVDSGECIELVLRLEIGHVRGRRQVSG